MTRSRRERQMTEMQDIIREELNIETPQAVIVLTLTKRDQWFMQSIL